MATNPTRRQMTWPLVSITGAEASATKKPPRLLAAVWNLELFGSL
jgi:hypothetical protein